MKLNKVLLASAVAAFASAAVSYADLTVDITGSTAFRSVAHQAILGALSDVHYSYSSDTGDATGTDKGVNKAKYAIFAGTVSGISGTVYVRTSWSGSATGTGTLVDGSSVSVPVTSTTLNDGYTQVFASMESSPAKFAFSDVSQGATGHLVGNTLEDSAVGVIPFEIVVSKDTPAAVTNMTDQLFGYLYSNGTAPGSMFTGNPDDSSFVLVATGRDAGSGTRITTLAETGYGYAKTVNQFEITSDGNGHVASETAVGNDGYSSGGTLAALLGNTTVGTSFADGYYVAYLGESDANTAINAGGRALTYNGVAFSHDNIINGQYTLWGFEHMFNIAGLSTDEDTFKTALLAAIPAAVTSTGAAINTGDLNVTRSGAEGGQINSKF